MLKNNLIAGALVVGIYAGVLIFPFDFFTTESISAQSKGFLFQSLFQNIENPLLLRILATFFLLIGAYLLNYFLIASETLSEPSFFVGFIYVLLGGTIVARFGLHPALIANVLLIFGAYRIFSAYRIDQAKGPAFDYALFFALASMFYPASILLSVFILIALFVLRPFVWREWILAAVGLVLPYLIAWAILFIVKRDFLFRLPFSEISFFSLSEKSGGIVQSVFASTLGLLLLSSFLQSVPGRKVRRQKNLALLTYWILLAVVTIFFDNTIGLLMPVLIIPPLSGRLGEWLGNFRKNLFSDIILLSLIGICMLVMIY